MRFCSALIVPLLAVSTAFAQKTAPRESTAALQTEDQKVLYTVGLFLGQRTADLNLTPAEMKYVSMGFKDMALGNKFLVSPSEYGSKVNAWANARQAAKAEKDKVRAEARMKKEKPFLEKAAKEKGAQVFPSGLIYTELQAGTGASPSSTDTVKAGYTGTLTNAKVFDSSASHGGPLQISLAPGGVIACWTEAFPKMKVGGKARLVCPAEIAYKSLDRPGIPPGSTLVFDVELVDIIKK